jgi:hypothetical protein
MVMRPDRRPWSGASAEPGTRRSLIRDAAVAHEGPPDYEGEEAWRRAPRVSPCTVETCRRYRDADRLEAMTTSRRRSRGPRRYGRGIIRSRSVASSLRPGVEAAPEVLCARASSCSRSVRHPQPDQALQAHCRDPAAHLTGGRLHPTRRSHLPSLHPPRQPSIAASYATACLRRSATGLPSSPM